MTIPGRFPPMVLAISVFLAVAASAEPTGPTIVSGKAVILQTGTPLQVGNSPNSIINWQTFPGGSIEVSRFAQPAATSAVLNPGTNPSASLGALQTNGRIFLINPNGVLSLPGSSASPSGQVMLQGNNKLELVDSATPNLRVEIRASENNPGDLRQIMDNVQRNGIYGGLVTNGGVTAQRAVVGADGRIYLKGPRSTPGASGTAPSPGGN